MVLALEEKTVTSVAIAGGGRQAWWRQWSRCRRRLAKSTDAAKRWRWQICAIGIPTEGEGPAFRQRAAAWSSSRGSSVSGSTLALHWCPKHTMLLNCPTPRGAEEKDGEEHTRMDNASVFNPSTFDDCYMALGITMKHPMPYDHT
nr:hypothetical protein Iba_chr05dCG10180 [Ipomoea batatas]